MGFFTHKNQTRENWSTYLVLLHQTKISKLGKLIYFDLSVTGPTKYTSINKHKYVGIAVFLTALLYTHPRGIRPRQFYYVQCKTRVSQVL